MAKKRKKSTKVLDVARGEFIRGWRAYVQDPCEATRDPKMSEHSLMGWEMAREISRTAPQSLDDRAAQTAAYMYSDELLAGPLAMARIARLFL